MNHKDDYIIRLFIAICMKLIGEFKKSTGILTISNLAVCAGKLLNEGEKNEI